MERGSIQRELERAHSRNAIKKRLEKGPRYSYLKDFIYGAIDGTVTTFAIVAGVAGANLATGIVIILGLANVAADGFSMAASNFLATRAERQLRLKAQREEEQHIALVPEGEKEEIRQIFAFKGFRGDDLDHIVKVITSDMKLWVDTMLRDELGLPFDFPSPWRSAIVTLLAFLCAGLLPLLSFLFAYLFSPQSFDPFFWSAVITGFTFFLVGACKSPFIKKSWIISGFETFFVGGCAAILSYFIGMFLKGITH